MTADPNLLAAALAEMGQLELASLVLKLEERGRAAAVAEAKLTQTLADLWRTKPVPSADAPSPSISPLCLEVAS